MTQFYPNLYQLVRQNLYNDIVNGTTLLKKVNNMTYLNLYISYKDLLTKGLSLGVGVYNIFGQNLFYVNAYDVGVNFTPMAGREFLVRLRYDL